MEKDCTALSALAALAQSLREKCLLPRKRGSKADLNLFAPKVQKAAHVAAKND